jgi:branched-chain amino acid transport system ATP-binding protein
MTAPLLEVRGLGVRFGGFVALKDVSWAVSAGTIHGIIGPNGAGKSTCFNAASNMVRHSGSILLDGEDVTALPPFDLAARGVRRTFQQNAFFGGLSVLENMVAVLSRSRGTRLWEASLRPWAESRRRRQAEAVARQCLDRFHIPAALQQQAPASLPYGIQRMLSIALAYADGPRALLLDEPAAGLGGGDMDRLASVLRQLRAEGLGIVLIEHHMDLIMELTDRITVLDQGQMLAQGTPAEIRHDPRVLEAYLGRAA